MTKFCQLTEALALVGGSIDEHLGGDDVSERQEHLHQLSVAELLRQVVDEEIAALRPAYAAPWRTDAELRVRAGTADHSASSRRSTGNEVPTRSRVGFGAFSRPPRSPIIGSRQQFYRAELALS